MNETLSVYLDCNTDEKDMKDIIQRMNGIISQEGWKYTGLWNYYAPMDQMTRDETINRVVHALETAKWLKPYKPRVMTGNKVSSVSLNNIDITGMSAPSEKKWKRYEDYYSLTKLLPHGIVVDENRKIRDGYISCLLAKKYELKPDILDSWSNKPVKKIVIGKHVNWDGENCSDKSEKLYCWIYNLKEAVIPGDILLVNTRKGPAYMQVSRIEYITGKFNCTKYKRVKKNETADL